MNEKKDKKGKQEKRNFWQHSSFFVVVVVGMAVVAIAAILNSMVPKPAQQASSFDSSAWTNAVAEVEEDYAPVNADTLPTNAVPTAAPEVTAAPKATATPMPSATPEVAEAAAEYEDEITDAGVAVVSENEVMPTLIKPMDAEVQKDFSGEDLAYSETMNDWRVHEGVDLRAVEGDDVKAAADGVVEEAYEDDLLGMTIVIRHSGNIRTLYANLQDLSGVTVGQAVKSGDIIGQVGKTATLEVAEQPHLHFEVIKDMQCVNPSEYMN